MNLRDLGTRLHASRLDGSPATVLPLVPIVLLLQGCGGEAWQAETYPARGQITINGEPPEGAVIELHSKGQQPDVRNSRPWGLVQPDGSFVLSTYESGDGAPAGEYAVVIRWPPDASQPSFADRLGGAYSTAQKSEWDFTITEGENQLPPIEIVGVNVQSKDDARPPQKAPPGPAVGN
ncbi:hypothetical protein FYK55_25925 [Roseiconus nitratireducens]|uniref:Uncharacterized protein n=1 Tax=Roseiconus nitratireducens TaxID=2605748 RepID=A0A5M6CUE2_9BACT|nr:hypothetical protein [Roseiconus nitratireducens]KAA5538878.1 hypothetical protein FYK55_25925 [Roseiconus nitratireducens]